jgi:hypothetical protein
MYIWDISLLISYGKWLELFVVVGLGVVPTADERAEFLASRPIAPRGERALDRVRGDASHE